MNKDRILNGKKAKVGFFPWMTLLIYNEPNEIKEEYLCGGSLITPSFVLTAAVNCDKLKLKKLNFNFLSS